MRRTRKPVALALVLSAGCVACGPGGGEPGRASVAVTHTDSAGVDVVLSDVPVGGAPAFAELAASPSLRLGSLDGAEEEQFGAIRDLAPLADGGVAVLDLQAAQVRLFDADGAYLRALGSKGEGPGELTRPVNLARLPGDTFAVYDGRAHRVTRYPADGGAPEVRTLQSGGASAPTLVSFFPDGRLAGSMWSLKVGNLPGEGEPAVSQDSAVIAVFSPSGDFADTAAVIANREIVVEISRVGQAINIFSQATAFARTGVFAAHRDGVWAGFGDQWELRLHDASTGGVRRILRAPGLERALTEQEMDAVHEAAVAGDTTPALRERTAEWWALSPRPEIRPTYDRILVDDQARLWLREWPGADGKHQRWWVFQGDGGLLGYVDAPEGVTLMAVSGGSAWGVVRDDLDVQYVVRHPMTVREP